MDRQTDPVIYRQPSFDMTGLDATCTTKPSLSYRNFGHLVSGTLIAAPRPGRGWLLCHTGAVALDPVRKTLQGTAENV